MHLLIAYHGFSGSEAGSFKMGDPFIELIGNGNQVKSGTFSIV